MRCGVRACYACIELRGRTDRAGRGLRAGAPPNTGSLSGSPTFVLTTAERALLHDAHAMRESERTHSHLLWGPDIEIYGLDFADMRAHGAMDAGASNAQKHAAARADISTTASLDQQVHVQVPGSPSWVYRA